MTDEEKQEEKFAKWIHLKVTDPVLFMKFEEMMKAHQGGRSAFIRWLIEREWARRSTGPLTELPAVLPDSEQRQDNGKAHWVKGSPPPKKK